MKMLQIWHQLTSLGFWLWFSNPDNLEIIKTFATIAVGVGVFLNFYTATKNTKIAQDNAKTAQDNVKIAESRLLTERFSKAVEQLSHEKMTVRLGGIYTLEKIARDSRNDYHWTVMEVLTSFLRENASSSKGEPKPLLYQVFSQFEQLKEPPKPDTDIQAVLTVIGRLRCSQEYRHLEEQSLDLCGVNIQGADLRRAHLEGALFIKANLEEVNLRGAHLEGVNFCDARLSGAELYSANLQNANLCNAYLQKVKCLHSHLEDTLFYDAHLEEADFQYSHLDRAQFCRAHLKDARFAYAYMEKVKFTEANLEGVWLNDAYLKQASFYSANLKKTSFNDSNLRKACFKYARLEQTLFIDADLEGVDFSGASLDSVKGFTKAQLNPAIELMLSQHVSKWVLFCYLYKAGTENKNF